MSSKTKWVSYVRVSSKEQGHSGLGLEAQTRAIAAHIAKAGGELVGRFEEVASGGDKPNAVEQDRPQFAAALRLAHRFNGTLIVSKLDRLSRTVATIAALIHEGTKLLVTEIPEASTLELHMRAVFAQEERSRISSNTKAALKVAKSRGVLLGSARKDHWKGREKLRAAGGAKGVAKSARVRLARWAPERAAAQAVAVELRAGGASLALIAKALNLGKHCTASGGQWVATQVLRLL